MPFDRPGRTAFTGLLQPGLYLKRWFALLTFGLVLLSLGIVYALVDLYRTADLPAWVFLPTLQFLPRLVRAVLFGTLGLSLCAAAVWGLYRSLADAVSDAGTGQLSLLEMVYQFRRRRGGPRIVCIGGGTGMPSVLRGLKRHTANITAIVTVGDDGGSSGRLRREHGILPPGDFRNNIVALAEVEPLMSRLFQYRFDGGSLDGHSFGNLFMLAMTGVTGNFEQALRETSRVLAVKGTILPSTQEDVTICARYEDGSEICGESRIPEQGKRIDHVFLQPERPSAQPEAVKAILEADVVVLGPGSLYTSVIPNLLVEGVAKALQQTEAVKIYVCNVATQPGETDGYGVEEHVQALARHLPGKQNAVDVVLAHRHQPGAPMPDSRATMISPRPASASAESGRPRIVLENVVRDEHPLRHDPGKLGDALIRIYHSRQG